MKMGQKLKHSSQLASPYVFVKDLSEPIIDLIYDNCTAISSEQKYLLLMGVSQVDILAYYENKCASVLRSRIETILIGYTLQKEDFVSEFDGYKIVLFWADGNPIISVKQSPYMTNAAVKLYRSDNVYLNPNKKGRIKAYAIPENWWHKKPRQDHIATLIG